MLLKQHLDMIGRNEPIQRKAKFWQSYVRALKDEPEYLAEDAWDAHSRRLEAIDELLPLKYRYPHYYRPRSSSVPPVARSSSLPPTTLRALSRARSVTPAPPHLRDIAEEKTPVNSLYSYTGLNESSSKFNEAFSKAVTSYSSSSSSSRIVNKRTTTYIPIRSTRINTEIIRAYLGHTDAYSWPGEPLYHRPYYGSYVRRPLSELLEPSIHLPLSRITRDPWWWDYPTLRPYSPYNRYPYTSYRYPLSPWWRNPSYLRNSYLSPIKRTYLWSYHPVRPFSYNYYWI